MGANLYKNQSQNVLRTWVLMLMFFLLVISIGWFLSYYFGNPNILYFAFLFSILLNFLSYWKSDKIVLKISGAKKVTRDQYFDLYNIVENLSITAGLPRPKIYVINDPAPNAFATGRNKEHSVVAVTTGLLNMLEKNELEGVIAHELSHIGNRDILLQTIVVTLVGLITLLADWFWRINFFGRSRNDRSGGQLQTIIMIAGLILMILSPIIASLIQLSISRKREYLADSTGALLTRYPEGLASALEKISDYDGAIKRANHATAHLYISNPYGKKKNKKTKASRFSQLFMTHPPIEKRVAKLRGQEI